MGRRKNPFKGHRFPKDIILLAVRWYCPYPLSYRDVRAKLLNPTVDCGCINRNPSFSKQVSDIPV